MTGNVIIWMWGGLLAMSVLLLVTGLRGRRVNNHPVCRECRFDLVGSRRGDGSLSIERCPMCGTELLTRHSIGVGLIRRRAWTILIGLLLIAAVLAAAGHELRGRVLNHGWSSIKPAVLLIREAGSDDEGTSRRAFEELARRLNIGALSAGAQRSIVRKYVRREIDGWVPLLDTLCRTGAMTGDARADYLFDSTRFEVDAAREQTSGAGLSLLPRVARSAPLPGRCVLTLERGSFAGRELPTGTVVELDGDAPGGGRVIGDLEVRAPVEPGHYFLESEWRVEFRIAERGGDVVMGSGRLSLPFWMLVPIRERAFEAHSPDGLGARLAPGIALTSLIADASETTGALQALFRIRLATNGGAFDVSFEQDGHVWKGDPIEFQAGPMDRVGELAPWQSERIMRLAAPGVTKRPIDVVLTPRGDDYRYALEPNPSWDGRWVMKAVAPVWLERDLPLDWLYKAKRD